LKIKQIQSLTVWPACRGHRDSDKKTSERTLMIKKSIKVRKKEESEKRLKIKQIQSLTKKTGGVLLGEAVETR